MLELCVPTITYDIHDGKITVLIVEADCTVKQSPTYPLEYIDWLYNQVHGEPNQYT